MGKRHRARAAANRGDGGSVTAAIRKYFADSKVERDEYEHLIDQMPGADEDDHDHMAAAVALQPCTILTKNAKDFPSKPLRERGARVGSPVELHVDNQ